MAVINPGSQTTTDADDKRDAVGGFLEEVAGRPMDEVVDEIMAELARAEAEADALEQQRREAALETARQKEKEVLASLQQLAVDNAPAADDDGYGSIRDGISAPGSVPQLTSQERKQREAILMKYAYDMDELVEGADGSMEVRVKDRSAAGRADAALMENRNAKDVHDREKAQRERAKEESAKQKEKMKEMQELDRLKKEKERKRTQRRERPRG